VIELLIEPIWDNKGGAVFDEDVDWLEIFLD
jgi:hypothetical protein